MTELLVKTCGHCLEEEIANLRAENERLKKRIKALNAKCGKLQSIIDMDVALAAERWGGG